MTNKRRSYYAFRRAVRDEYKVAWKDTAIVWRLARERFETPRARDVARHPRIIGRTVATALVAAQEVTRRARPLPTVAAPSQEVKEVVWRRPPLAEFEATIKYSSKGQTVDVTVRLAAPRHATNEEIQRMLIVARIHPELAPDGFREFKLLGGIDWRRDYLKGRRAVTTESSGGAEDLKAFRGILRDGTWRIARVD